MHKLALRNSRTIRPQHCLALLVVLHLAVTPVHSGLAVEDIRQFFSGVEDNVGGPPTPTQPFFEIVADTLYDAGLQQGKLAGTLIREWFSGKEMTDLMQFTATEAGAAAFAALKADNTKAFPDLVEEMKGVADGAGVSLDQVWVINMLEELENIRTAVTATAPGVDHCTDIYAGAGVTTDKGVWLGHNEDWSEEVAPLVYWVAVKPSASASGSFRPCAGFVYPGALIGNAATWAPEGYLMTQNALFPRKPLSRGLAATFVQRQAICQGHTTTEDILDGLTMLGQSNGFNVNLADTASESLISVEVLQDTAVVTFVPGNYSHENMYVGGDLVGQDYENESTLHRQATIDSLPAPTTRSDVLAILGDTSDPDFPVFRPITVYTLLFNAGGDESDKSAPPGGTIEVWTGQNPAKGPPSYVWSLPTFFDFNATVAHNCAHCGQASHQPAPRHLRSGAAVV